MNTTVTFDMWGQRCVTVFDENSELDPIAWLERMYEKGWLLPVSLVNSRQLDAKQLLILIDSEREQYE